MTKAGPGAWVETDPKDPTHYTTTEAGRHVPPCTCRDCLRHVETGPLIRRLEMYERGAEAIRAALRRRA